jgi:hypothetical protein
LTHESQQERQQRIAPGQRAIQIEEGYPGLRRDVVGRLFWQIITFKYIKIFNLYRIIIMHLSAGFRPQPRCNRCHYDLFQSDDAPRGILRAASVGKN